MVWTQAFVVTKDVSLNSHGPQIIYIPPIFILFFYLFASIQYEHPREIARRTVSVTNCETLNKEQSEPSKIRESTTRSTVNMVAKSRVLNEMIMDISYNVVGKNDEDIIMEESAYGAPEPAVQPNEDLSSRSGPSSATTASHSNRTSLSSMDDFPVLGPAKNPLKAFPTNPNPFPGLAQNTLRMQPISIPATTPAPAPAPVMEPLPPPVRPCSSAFCNIESFHEAKPYSVQDKNRPKYVKQLEERLQKAKARGIKVGNWWEIEFLNIFYSVHWAGGAMVVPAPPKADGAPDDSAAKKNSGSV